MSDAAPRIAALYRYPVKGLSAEPLDGVAVSPGGTFPFDRAFAIENGPSGFDPAAPRPLPKAAFLMLMRNERLARLVTRYDEAAGTLTVREGGAVVAEGRLDRPEGRAAVEAFFDRFEADELRGPARIVAAPGHSFSDAGENYVSLINLETVKAMEARFGAAIHPLRFRGNLYVSGLPAFAELDLVGRRVTAGGAVFTVEDRINRCAATNVNPETGARDLTIPRSLLEAYGHPDCGVYLRVATGGRLAVGDAVSVA